VYFICPQCGIFGLPNAFENALAAFLDTPRKRAVLSYGIRKTPPGKGRETPVFYLDDWKKIVDADELPTPQEIGDNVIRWLGNHLAGPGSRTGLPAPEAVGALNESGLVFIAGEL